MMDTLFAIFYVDDAYIASTDPVFLQRAINGLVSAFERVGLETNTEKTQAMTCTPGTINIRSTSSRWWPKSYSIGRRVRCTGYRWALGNSNARFPCARGSWQTGMR